MDEVELKVNGEKAWDINAIDSKTKYNLEGLFTLTKITLIFAIFFSLLKERIHDQVLEGFEKEKHKPEKKRNLITFVSDGLAQYKTCFEDFFGGIAKLVHNENPRFSLS